MGCLRESLIRRTAATPAGRPATTAVMQPEGRALSVVQRATRPVAVEAAKRPVLVEVVARSVAAEAAVPPVWVEAAAWPVGEVETAARPVLVE